MKPFKPIPCDEHQMKSLVTHKVIGWLLGTMFFLIVGLIGVVYSSIENQIGNKADKAIVTEMKDELTLTRQAIERVEGILMNKGKK